MNIGSHPFSIFTVYNFMKVVVEDMHCNKFNNSKCTYEPKRESQGDKRPNYTSSGKIKTETNL